MWVRLLSDHVGPDVVTGGVNSFVAVHARVGSRTERLGVMQHSAEELMRELGEPAFVLLVEKQVPALHPVPRRDVRVAAVTGVGARTASHERGSKPVLLRDRLHHELEERLTVGGDHFANASSLSAIGNLLHQLHGCTDGCDRFDHPERARSFAVLALDFVNRMLEKRIEQIESIDTGAEFEAPDHAAPQRQ